MFLSLLRTKRVPAEKVQYDLTNQCVVFTGGTDGMGLLAVKRLVQMNATVYVVGRNKEKTNRTVDDLNNIAGTTRAVAVECDLASLNSVRKCVDILLKQCSRIDLLVNCAGTIVWERKLSPDGYELNWAVNYLGPHLLTQLLLDRLKHSEPSRIIHLSSSASGSGKIHFDDLQLERGWGALKAYSQAKLATNMATRALDSRLKDSRVTVNVLHPGFTKTALVRDAKGVNRIFGLMMKAFASPTEVASERILTVALSTRYKDMSGKYFYEDGIREHYKTALDDVAVERLWEISQDSILK